LRPEGGGGTAYMKKVAIDWPVGDGASATVAVELDNLALVRHEREKVMTRVFFRIGNLRSTTPVRIIVCLSQNVAPTHC
jgi:hypothetical protein